MAEQRLVIDSSGIVTSPARWAGRHVDEVMNYLEGLEQALSQPEPPPAPPEAPPEAKPPQTPADRLAASAAARVDPMQQAMLHRAIQDDEDSFAATVSDYDKYREDIHKVRANLAPAQLIQRGLHRTLYINIKTAKDRSVQERVFAPVEPAPPIPPEEPPAPAPEPPTPPPVARGPQPAPPIAKPTPAARSAEPPAKPKSKLVPTAKITEFCRATNQNVDAYLLKLEANGMTQEELDNAGQLGRRNHAEGRTLVYNRPRAGAS